ncbi:MAG: hypothetical protein M0R77_00565 [Gammaproteobacteria bacterium]|nr:hypothetical protein [Acholeplasmataceae bacterium]MCK9529046.1 hypothetical protein [Gammaproteobacteria bacterium]
MKVLRNHFNNNPTVVIHGRIINGCRNFTLEEAPNILKYYKVPDDIWQEVLDVYSPTSTDEEIESFINDENFYIRKLVAIYGNDKHRDALINDKSMDVRNSVAIYGNDSHRDILVKDKISFIREAVARHGNSSQHDILVKDEDWVVRVNVARFGSNSHRELLKNDTDLHVRNIAIFKLRKK